MAEDPDRPQLPLSRSPLAFLEDWYASQCDSDWEHSFGIHIETLDNPGWTLKIDLEGTVWDGKAMERAVVQRGEHDWFQAWSDGQAWQAHCGPQNLGEVIEAFREFLHLPAEDGRDDVAPAKEPFGSQLPRLQYVYPDLFRVRPGLPKSDT